ncbi:MAG: 2-C-methyl-D-erythritol 2,4-cyclodiphosphate synthase [Candidatus Tritonobacter lacicola]|nr:2-C-methyl-D-erythritol 2,4-cyclodiphosphate synthase [Candidatus Tritonobacter lacicola]
MRVGIGYDIHRLAQGRKLVLGGVELEHGRGLLGHSDADVLIHAICDAILGACALGDIGTHFPDDDPRFKDADSTELLGEVSRMIREEGWEIGNIDCTVMAEEPRIAPHIKRMRQRLADTLSTDISRVSVKATRGEGVGPVGRREAIAALAIAALEETSLNELVSSMS